MRQQMIRHVRSAIVRPPTNTLNSHKPPPSHTSFNFAHVERPSAIGNEGAGSMEGDPDQNALVHAAASGADSTSAEVIERAIKEQSGPAGAMLLFSACDSVTCPEALMWLSAIVFYQMRSRVYPTSGLG